MNGRNDVYKLSLCRAARDQTDKCLRGNAISVGSVYLPSIDTSQNKIQLQRLRTIERCIIAENSRELQMAKCRSPERRKKLEKRFIIQREKDKAIVSQIMHWKGPIDKNSGNSFKSEKLSINSTSPKKCTSRPIVNTKEKFDLKFPPNSYGRGQSFSSDYTPQRSHSLGVPLPKSPKKLASPKKLFCTSPPTPCSSNSHVSQNLKTGNGTYALVDSFEEYPYLYSNSAPQDGIPNSRPISVQQKRVSPYCSESPSPDNLSVYKVDKVYTNYQENNTSSSNAESLNSHHLDDEQVDSQNDTHFTNSSALINGETFRKEVKIKPIPDSTIIMCKAVEDQIESEKESRECKITASINYLETTKSESHCPSTYTSASTATDKKLEASSQKNILMPINALETSSLEPQVSDKSAITSSSVNEGPDYIVSTEVETAEKINLLLFNVVNEIVDKIDYDSECENILKKDYHNSNDNFEKIDSQVEIPDSNSEVVYMSVPITTEGCSYVECRTKSSSASTHLDYFQRSEPDFQIYHSVPPLDDECALTVDGHTRTRAINIDHIQTMQRTIRGFIGRNRFQAIKYEKALGCGVLGAMPGTKQGQSGWYQDPRSYQASFFIVNAKGEWKCRASIQCKNLVINTHQMNKKIISKLNPA